MAAPWNAARNGTLQDGGTSIQSAQVNQFLSVHPSSAIYPGTQVFNPYNPTVAAGGITQASKQLSTLDVDQPFTMSGTTIGRVQIPLLAVGNGADLLVSLCSDSSGSPGTVLQQTRIPKEWITNLSAVTSAPVSVTTVPLPTYTGSPLATSAFNTIRLGATTTGTWHAALVDNANPGSTNITYYDTGSGLGYLFVAGGSTKVSGTAVPTTQVYTAAFNSSGAIVNSLAQPALPLAVQTGGLVVAPATQNGQTSLTLVLAGGTISSTITADVFAASFDPGTGVIGSWSSQTALPAALTNIAIAAGNGYVYVIGGENVSAQFPTTVYYAAVSNGQITAWNTTSPIPAAAPTLGSYATVIGNQVWLFTGNDTSYYANIQANGSLSQWYTGPVDNFALVANFSIVAFGNYGFLSTPGQPLAVINGGAAPTGFSYEGGSTLSGFPGPQGTCFIAPGQWATVFANYSNSFASATAYLQPAVSVPLPTTGLTNGTTYHLLMQQQGGDLNDYLWLATNTTVATSPTSGVNFPTLLTSSRNAYTWTATTPAATAVPFSMFTNTAPSGAPSLPLHTWEDNGARISTLVYSTTPDQRLLGICDATQKGKALNSNPGFEFTILPWGTSSGTLVRSSTQAYESNWSAQMTPNGTSANVFFQSENLQCLPGQSITVSMWVYAVNAITTNFSGTLFWYNAAGTFLSESDNLVSIPAATWTHVTNTFTAPTGAYQFTINPRQSGTPPVGNVFFVDNAYAFPTYAGEQFVSILDVGWAGTWPSQVYPPTGITQLA